MEKLGAVEVLLVEDREEDAHIALRELKKNNLANEIKWVEDGKEALDYIFGEADYAGRSIANKPKLILLDLKMPKLNGIETLKRIKANQNTKNIPVVVMTSSKEDKDIESSYGLGVNSYIVKPMDFGKFAAAIKEVGVYWLLMNEGPK